MTTVSPSVTTGIQKRTNTARHWMVTATIPEIDSYVFLHQVWGWLVDLPRDVSISSTRIDSTVNINDSCNAYFARKNACGKPEDGQKVG